jgi:ankyrin repeat protein
MCVNGLPKIEAQLQADSSIATAIGDDGWLLLHHEALAGNLGVVKLLIAFGADPAARTPNGYTASDLASKLGWSEIAALLQQ